MRASLPLLPWGRLALAAAAAPAGTWLLVRSPDVGATGVVRATLAASVPLALAVAFILDDPSDEWLSYTPVPRSVRRCARMLLAAPAVAVGWGATLTVASLQLNGMQTHAPLPRSWDALDPMALPWADLTVGAAALCAISLAAASVAALSSTHGDPGLVAATAVLVVCAAALALPEPATLVVDWAPRRAGGVGQLDDWYASWAATRDRWVVLAVGGGAVTAAAWLDPGRRGPACVLRNVASRGATTARRHAAGPGTRSWPE